MLVGLSAVRVEVDVKTEFVMNYSSDALLVENACDFPAKLLLTIAALETGWGQHVYENNLFGIYYHEGLLAAEAASETETLEYIDNEFKKVPAIFAKYDSQLHSMLAFVAKIRNEERYRDSWNSRFDFKQFFENLESAGYATDPEYSEKLSIIYLAFPDLEIENEAPENS